VTDRSAPLSGPLYVRLLAALVLPLLILSAAPGLRAQGASAQQVAAVADYAAVQRARVYHATRTSDEIKIDGAVDETAWDAAEVGTGFYQTDPKEGIPATEETEFRILYDQDQIYVAVIAHQKESIIISDLKREFAATDGDQIALFFDTFGDKRNGFGFMTNPGSAMHDMQIAAGQLNESWDGVYEVASKIYDWGWSAEFAIPFKTLRFDDTGAEQSWGFNIQRIMRAKNEWVQWSPAPRPFRVFEPTVAGTLDGISGVKQGMNLKVKPYVLGNAHGSAGGFPGQRPADAGADMKIGLTSGLTLDLTANTDFSQVEADDQQVNLTRFGLFFQEKREFFLENVGIVDVCGNAVGPGGPGGNNGRCGAEKDIVPFFSRTIGLSPTGQPLRMRGGGRLTGKLAGLDVGMVGLNVSGVTDGAPADTWMVGRLRRDVLNNSQVGAFYFDREPASGAKWNRVEGADGNFNFFRQTLNFSGFLMRSETPTQSGGLAASAQMNYQSRMVTFTSSVVGIGSDFQNDFGFTPRKGILKLYDQIGLTPRFQGIVRDDNPRFIFRHTLDGEHKLVTKFDALGNTTNFRDGSSVTVFRNFMFDRLDKPFVIQGKTVPVGDYSYADAVIRFNSSRARRLNVGGSYRSGEFYNGSKKEIGASAGLRYDIHFQTSASWTRALIDLPSGGVTTDLLAVHADAAFSPKMFLQSYVQLNTATKTVSSNIRYRFIHHPLSDFFVVYNEVRPTEGTTATVRSISLKMTELVNF
jgi:hypothetical protein